MSEIQIRHVSEAQTKHDALVLLYQENTRHHLHLVDLRHRVLIRYLFSTAALMVFAKWIFESTEPLVRCAMFAPCLLATLATLVFYFMDKRNTMVINASKTAGKKIEENISDIPGIYRTVSDSNARYIPHGLVSMSLYLGSAIVCGILTIVFFVRFEAWELVL